MHCANDTCDTVIMHMVLGESDLHFIQPVTGSTHHCGYESHTELRTSTAYDVPRTL
jgi:hypothetical protein